jgi:glutamine amidotransferase
MKIGIINYGTGNIYSISSALNEIGADHIVINSSTELFKADAIILPGVGSFSDTKKKLDEHYWTEEIIEFVTNKSKALLGICLGMQLLCCMSEEGQLPGLGFVNADVRKFRSLPGDKLKIPHMGWNTIRVTRTNPLIENSGEEQRFYFVHSYHLAGAPASQVLGEVDYGGPVTAVVGRDNIIGTQFHPEKSQEMGLRLFKNFISWKP